MTLRRRDVRLAPDGSHIGDEVEDSGRGARMLEAKVRISREITYLLMSRKVLYRHELSVLCSGLWWER